MFRTPDTTTSSHGRALYASCVALFFLLLAVVISRLFLSESLWLDEGITWWVSKDGPVAAWSRAIAYQGQSPLYYIIVSLIFFLTPDPAEFLLRLPSVLFLIVGIIVARRILRALSFSAAASFLGISVLIASPLIMRMCSARPYALAFCALMVSIYCWVNFLTTRRNRYFVAACIGGAVTIYAHYLFGVGLVSWWLLSMMSCILSTGCLFTPRAFSAAKLPCVATIIVAVLTLPFLAPQLLSLAARAHSISAFAIPTVTQYLAALAVMPLAVVLPCAFFATLTFDAQARLYNRANTIRKIGALAIVWVVVVGIFWVLSVATGASLFVDRYYAWAMILWTLATAVLFDALVTAKSKTIFAALLFLMLVGSEAQRRWLTEDWRSGVELVNNHLASSPQTLLRGAPCVIVAPGLVEAEDTSWYLGERAEYLKSVVSYYGIASEDIWLSPKSFNNQEYIEAQLLHLFDVRSEVLFMYLAPLSPHYIDVILAYATARGFVADEVQSGLVRVIRLVKVG